MRAYMYSHMYTSTYCVPQTEVPVKTFMCDGIEEFSTSCVTVALNSVAT